MEDDSPIIIRAKYTPFVTIEDARVEIFEYIEDYYNTKRRHSDIVHQTPNEFETQFYILIQVIINGTCPANVTHLNPHTNKKSNNTKTSDFELLLQIISICRIYINLLLFIYSLTLTTSARKA
ncbi:MAG: IS3 family transposase [Ignavibacteriae bacterium]|nr:IS3 family transposase [Ignavibacteriota bacterium]